MVNSFAPRDSITSSLIADSHSPLSRPSAAGIFTSAQAEQAVSHWLAQLLEHFNVQKLDAASDQELTDYLSAFTQESAVDLRCDAQSQALIAELRRRVIRLAGAQLDDAFASMTPDIVDEADVVPTLLSIEGRELHGVRYRGDVYRKIEEFQPCHRLQSYCLAQTLSERQIPYVMTRSQQRFAVWVSVQSLPMLRQ